MFNSYIRTAQIIIIAILASAHLTELFNHKYIHNHLEMRQSSVFVMTIGGADG